MSDTEDFQEQETGEFGECESPMAEIRQKLGQLHGENVQLKLLNESLRTIINETYTAVGGDFYAFLVQELAGFCSTSYSFLAQVVRDDEYRILAWHGPGEEVGMVGVTTGLPGENRPRDRLSFYSRGVAKEFFHLPIFTGFVASSYLALPVFHPQGRVLGYLGVIDTIPLQDNLANIDILKALAARAGAELAREEAEKNQQMKYLAKLGEMSSVISHEIRNPLGAIKLNLRNLTKVLELEPTEERLLTNLKEGIHRIEKVVEDILSYSRTAPPRQSRVDLNHVVQSLLRNSEDKYREKEVDLQLELSDDPVPVVGDPYQILQVLENLVRNAVRSLGPEDRKVGIVTSLDDREGKLVVWDRGKGISKGQLKRIFDPFYTTRNSGTGLGLAICHQIIEMHRGQMEVESRPGEGTQLTVTLPRMHD